MDEIIEATPEGLLEEAKEVVESILTLPVLGEELELLSSGLKSLQDQMAVLGIVNLFLVVAVVFLLWKHFKK